METYRIMIVAGEPSGDAHAAALVHALRKAGPQAHFEFFGATGPLLRAAGVDAVVRTDDLAIMRTVPNTISQPVQGGTDGRYTFMGNLNPYAGFQTAATGC